MNVRFMLIVLLGCLSFAVLGCDEENEDPNDRPATEAEKQDACNHYFTVCTEDSAGWDARDFESMETCLTDLAEADYEMILQMKEYSNCDI
ncbi:MAG: hypothetical protein GY854_08105 [Deltaproteobacteria bacterium]|nr:hypothetical protein [Deltaproteobacteria bacterium]